MIERLQILIWYALVLILFLVIYAVTTSFNVAIVDAEFRGMEPTIEGGSIQVVDRRHSTIRSLERDDVVCFRVHKRDKTKKLFGRVLATSGSTVSYREKRLVVDGQEVADAPDELAVLQTGLIIPRDTVFAVFDSTRGGLPLADRLVRYADVVGRVMWK
ncbi:MAG: signal peptidase I [Planctomycetota bacterium]